MGDIPQENRSTALKSAVEGNDAVCFTAGIEGAAFGAGTIHAHLSADRKPPAIVAGISLGALNAAAMQKAYRLLKEADGKNSTEREAARWKWFREYLQALSDQPLNIVWNGIPDQSDFFADMEPIRATVPEQFAADEAAARRSLYLLVKLGRWLASLPLSIRRVTDLLVNWVRLVGEFLHNSDKKAEAESMDEHFVDKLVDAAVLPVFPASVDHLNPTFAFCASTGLQDKRVLRSIADGCFQTLYAFADKQTEAQEQTFEGRSVKGLVEINKIPTLTLRQKQERVAQNECPFFKRDGKPITCPFLHEDATRKHPEARRVYATCKKDFLHWESISPRPASG